MLIIEDPNVIFKCEAAIKAPLLYKYWFLSGNVG